MNNMTSKPPNITVLYACQGGTGTASFPEQTLPAETLQILSVCEDDPCHPRKNSLRMLDKANGEFTIFLDEGDVFAADFLEKLRNGAYTPDAAFAMASSFFDQNDSSNEYFHYRPEKDVLLDARELLPVLPFELHGLMFRTDRLREIVSLQSSELEAEKKALLPLLNQYPFFFWSADCTIHRAQPGECDYQYCAHSRSREWYYDSLERFMLPFLAAEQRVNGYIPCLHQQLAFHMLHMRMHANLNNRNKGIIPPEDAPAYMELFSAVLSYIDERVILSKPVNPYAAFPKNRLFDLRLKKQDYSWYPSLSCTGKRIQLMCGRYPLSSANNLQIGINLIDYKNNCLEIDGETDDLFSDDLACIYAEFDGTRYPIIRNSRYSMSKCFGVTYSRMKTFHVSIPLPDVRTRRTLRFFLDTKDMQVILEYAFPSYTSRFSKTFPHACWRFGPWLSWADADGIHVERASVSSVLFRELLTWKQIYSRRNGAFRSQLPLKMLNFVLRPYFSRQKIWLFFDKIYKGGDSSEYLYRYARKQKDGIRKYYLLDPASADFARMKEEGLQPLKRGSLRHRLLFLNADLVIASNSTVFAFNDYTLEKSYAFRGDFHFEVACVQHGMSVQKIALAQNRLRDNTQLYFCASKYEMENLSRPVYDYKGYDILRLTGVPRYDGLENRAQKIILISPTWRMNSALQATKGEGVERDYNPHFRETDYFRIYNSLINDPQLLAAAEKYGYRIQYVLHPIVSPQARDFTGNDFVEIIPSAGDMSYEKILCEAALMVTDYSGVQFDFAYMRKPVVYLHHEDIPQHYEEGTFHYATMSFGEICHTNDELIRVLCGYMENQCQMPERYRKRADDFFAYSDHNNCARIYPALLEHMQKKEK